MKTLLTSPELRAELPGWALRGTLCAAGSAFWAVQVGFDSPSEIAGMVIGVAFWVVIFAGGCAWLQQQAWRNQATMVSVLKWAAWVKALTSLLPIVDVVLGAVALALVSGWAGTENPEGLGKLDSFDWTLLTTLAEGLLMALFLATLAVLLWLLGHLAAFCNRIIYDWLERIRRVSLRQ